MGNTLPMGHVRGGLMSSALDTRSSGWVVAGPGRGHRVVFLDKTLYSYSYSLHLGM